MNKIAYATLASVAVFALTACGSSDSAGESATAENVEMPAEEAMAGVDAAAAPASEAAASASDAAAAPAATPAAGASAAAEAATTEAEKKM